ncbi:helix-turn-helix domain-containing protein [Candidatus Microgenomates bacterium]|nr:helix-turn-helix domain-containing protein [Candidatus Microgenomates bacterium]
MRTFGSFFNQARRRRNLSVTKLAQKTKIKPHYIAALEKEQWHVFPNFTIARGFVYTIAGTIGVDPETAIAILRRDFQEQKKVREVYSPKVVWTPRLTLVFVFGIATVLLTGYLVSQYITYVAPPSLSLGEVVRSGETVKVLGKTNEEVSILVNGEPVLVDDDGMFSVMLSVGSGEKLILEARSRSGKATKKEIVVP